MAVTENRKAHAHDSTQTLAPATLSAGISGGIDAGSEWQESIPRAVYGALVVVGLAGVLAFFIGRWTAPPDGELTIASDMPLAVEEQLEQPVPASESAEDARLSVGEMTPYLYVANQLSNDISVIALDDHDGSREVKRISVGLHPSALFLSGNLLYVANEEGQSIHVIDILTDTVVGVIPVDGHPVSLVVVGNWVYYADHREGQLVKRTARMQGVAGEGNGADDAAGGDSETVVAQLNGARQVLLVDEMLYVMQEESNRVAAFNPAIDKVNKFFRVNERPVWMAASPEGNVLYVVHRESEDIAIVSLKLGRVVHTALLGGQPVGVSSHPAGKELAVLFAANDTVGFFSTALDRRIAALKVAASPSASLYSNDSRYLFVTNSYAGTVTIVDATNRMPVQQIAIGKWPAALVLASKIT